MNLNLINIEYNTYESERVTLLTVQVVKIASLLSVGPPLVVTDSSCDCCSLTQHKTM